MHRTRSRDARRTQFGRIHNRFVCHQSQR
jgi:hypothetical protein